MLLIAAAVAVVSLPEKSVPPTPESVAGKFVPLPEIVKTGTQVLYSKYSGTEVEFNGSNRLILKEDDIVGILETDEIKDLKPVSDRVLIKVEEAEETTAGGLLLTQASKEKPSIGTVIAVGPGPLNEEGVRTGLPLQLGVV